jgi:hypothetical protein
MLELLVKIYMLDSLKANSYSLFSHGYFGPGTHHFINQALDIAVKELRP